MTLFYIIDSIHVYTVRVCRIQCEFYMHDREGVSIEAERILVIIQTQTIVYLNSTEYRVLGAERANNASVTEPNATPSKDANALYIHTYVLLILCTCTIRHRLCVCVYTIHT